MYNDESIIIIFAYLFYPKMSSNMEFIQRKQEINSYVLGNPSLLASRRKISLQRINSQRRHSQKLPNEKYRILPTSRSPIHETIVENFSPKSNENKLLQLTMLPFIYAQIGSGRNTPRKDSNLPLDRKKPELFDLIHQEISTLDQLIRRNTCK